MPSGSDDGGRPPVRAVYPGTFDPFTPGHRDIVDRARRLFDHVTVLVAVNAGKDPSAAPETRARQIMTLLPADWLNVEVATWNGLTADYSRQHNCSVIIRGVRNAADYHHETNLAEANTSLGVPTLLLPARPELATMSSTVRRALQP